MIEHEGDREPLDPAHRAALWRDDRGWPLVDHVAVDDSRDGLYGYLPGGRRT